MVTTADDSRLTTLEERTAENTAVVVRLEEQTAENTAAIAKLEERTAENTVSIARLDERTAAHTAAVARLEDKVDKLVWVIIGVGATITVALLGGITGLGIAMLQLINRIAQ